MLVYTSFDSLKLCQALLIFGVDVFAAGWETEEPV